jgi:hypothetical protein
MMSRRGGKFSGLNTIGQGIGAGLKSLLGTD